LTGKRTTSGFETQNRKIENSVRQPIIVNIKTKNRIEDFLADIQFVSTEQFEMLVSIRKLFLVANSDLVESIKYGGLVFSTSSTLIAGIFAYKKHLSIDFSHGADFNDPYGSLEGNGKHRRHIKIYRSDDIDGKKSSYYINQATRIG
jgi:hypothetical protein